MKVSNSLFFIVICLIQITDVHAQEQTPDRIVKQTVDRVLIVLADENLNIDQKKHTTFELVREHIDFTDMSRRILATNWKSASDEQKVEFITLFEQMLLQSYWTRIKQYSGERVKYIAVSYDNESLATVDTVIIRHGQEVEIPISYRMRDNGHAWMAYDFLVENLSLVQNYRAEYQAMIKNQGIEGLLNYMRSEIKNISS